MNKEKPLLFDELKSYLEKNYKKCELRWQDITDPCIHKLNDGRPEGSTYFIGLYNILVSDLPIFKMNFQIYLDRPIENKPNIYANWLKIGFHKRFMKDKEVYVPNEIVVWYQNPNFGDGKGMPEIPCFEMRYVFPRWPCHDYRKTCESFISKSDVFFSAFSGLPEEARLQLSALTERLKEIERKVDKYTFIISSMYQ